MVRQKPGHTCIIYLSNTPCKNNCQNKGRQSNQGKDCLVIYNVERKSWHIDSLKTTSNFTKEKVLTNFVHCKYPSNIMQRQNKFDYKTMAFIFLVMNWKYLLRNIHLCINDFYGRWKVAFGAFADNGGMIKNLCVLLHVLVRPWMLLRHWTKHWFIRDACAHKLN